VASMQGEAYEVSDDAGWMNVTITNMSSDNTTTVVNETLGEIRYETGGTTVAYQGGGVWRADRSGASTMVSPPEFHYRNGTLTLPIISMNGTGDTNLDGSLTVEQNRTAQQRYPNATLNENFTNPLESGKVNVTVHSEYYRAWGSFFEERTDGNVSYDHPNNEVTITLLKKSGERKIKDGLMLTGANGELQIQSGNNAALDSYNSSTYDPDAGPNDPPSGSDLSGGANIVTGMDVKIDGGNVNIKGNLTTGGQVDMNSSGDQFEVDGYVKYGEGGHDASKCTDHVDEWCNDNASVALDNPIDGEVQSTLDDIEADNDNSGASCFTEGNALEWGNSGCGNTITIGAGDYYTSDDFDMADGSNKLKLDTTNGDIRIGVGSAVLLTNGNLTVLGNGTVKIYSENDIDIKNGKFWNRGWDAEQLWVFGSKSSQVEVASDPDFVGVIYAPSEPGASDSGTTITGGQTDIYGAVIAGDVGSTVSLENNADIHYDESLQNQTAFDRPTVPSLSYLHISVNRINVTSE